MVIIAGPRHRPGVFHRPERRAAVLSEAFHLLGSAGRPSLAALLRRDALIPAFDLHDDLGAVLRVIEKYADVPASLADACLVRMTETVDHAVLLTTDSDFRLYRRHGRQTVPAVLPSRSR